MRCGRVGSRQLANSLWGYAARWKSTARRTDDEHGTLATFHPSTWCWSVAATPPGPMRLQTRARSTGLELRMAFEQSASISLLIDGQQGCSPGRKA